VPGPNTPGSFTLSDRPEVRIDPTNILNTGALGTAAGVFPPVLSESPGRSPLSGSFPAGGLGAAHSRPHVQSTLVQSGRFEFTIAGERFEVGPGDAFVIPSNR